MAAGVLAGLAANGAFGWWWLDPVVALGIAAIAVDRVGDVAWRGLLCDRPDRRLRLVWWEECCE